MAKKKMEIVHSLGTVSSFSSCALLDIRRVEPLALQAVPGPLRAARQCDRVCYPRLGPLYIDYTMFGDPESVSGSL